MYVVECAWFSELLVWQLQHECTITATGVARMHVVMRCMVLQACWTGYCSSMCTTALKKCILFMCVQQHPEFPILLLQGCTCTDIIYRSWCDCSHMQTVQPWFIASVVSILLILVISSVVVSMLQLYFCCTVWQTAALLSGCNHHVCLMCRFWVALAACTSGSRWLCIQHTLRYYMAAALYVINNVMNNATLMWQLHTVFSACMHVAQRR